jgi:hypothetical protein
MEIDRKGLNEIRLDRKPDITETSHAIQAETKVHKREIKHGRQKKGSRLENMGDEDKTREFS